MNVLSFDSADDSEDSVNSMDKSDRLDGIDKLDSTGICQAEKPSNTTACNDVPVLRRAAMDYLARREHSLFELSQKLGKKYPETERALLLDVLEALKSENLQSDERFTESYVRYRKSRGFAYLHIKADLSERRVNDSLIAKYLLVDDEDWQLLAGQLVAKKLQHQASISFGSKTHRKLVRFLESRGFPSIIIRKTLEKHLCE